jgi:uncharacterized protein
LKTARLARAALLACALCWSCIAAAQVAVPPLSGRVTDQTGTLNAEQKATLEQTLQAFEARKGSQLAVLIVPTTAPEAIEQYSLRVAEKWKLGRKKVDDGAILVIAKADRAMRIEVGYGLEGALNDATCKRIISEIITPRFQQGDFNGGIAAGIDQMIRVVDGEPLPPPNAQPANGAPNIGNIGHYTPVIIMLALVIGSVLRSMLGRFPGALVTGGAVAGLAWLFAGALSMALIAGFIAFLFTLLGGGMAGMVGRGIGGSIGGNSGSGGFGGFSGGGGGFGGGGASGRW